ncbi:hypothetical protein NQ317_005535 [Molorchus minor]|uniref:Protein lethal(3)malignant blood neoplasm 1 n=1 Tax=Molorchus minor TaxID=1323400 RepID=A0ABQ9J5Y5_9CUCU|nr:hypothetical protein NQ317_005535 [Molorchus minor]
MNNVIINACLCNVSALDGSPATGPISPDAAKYLGKKAGNVPAAQPETRSEQPLQPTYQQPRLPTPPQSPQQAGQYPQLNQQSLEPPLQQPLQQFPQNPQPPPAITQRPKPYKFTTQPTIKPACGGCGYVTTAQPLSNQPFQFQDPTFQNGQNGKNQLSANNSPNLQNQGYVQPSSGLQNIPLKNFQSQQQAARPPTNIQNQQTGQLFNQNLGSSVSDLLPPGINDQNQEYADAQQGGPFGNGKGSTQYSNIEPIQQVSPLTAQFGSGQNLPGVGSIGSQNTGTSQLLIRNGGSLGGSIPFSPGVTTELGRKLPSRPYEEVQTLPPISVSDNVIHVGGNKPTSIPIRDKYPGMTDGLPDGIEEKDINDLLYKFHYTVGFHGHYEKGLKDGTKIGGYFVNGRDGISRVVTYIADENGYRPKFKFINLGLDSADTPKIGTEKQFGLKSFEFVWYPIE